MPKLIAISLGLLMLAIAPAHAAQAGASVDSELFGKDPGKNHVFACFTRRYDEAHLKAHPKQNVTDMRVLVDSDFGTEYDDQRSYAVTLGTNFRTLKKEFQSYGGCGGTDEAKKTLNCYIDCDGGAIDVRLKDADNILVDIPYGARLYDPDAPEDEDPGASVPPKAEFGPDDQTFLLTRVSSRLCADLAGEDDKQLLLDSAQ